MKWQIEQKNENKRARVKTTTKKITYIIYINYYLWYEECFQFTAKGSGTC